MKIGLLGKQNAFALEMLRRLQSEHPEDQFSASQPGDQAPSAELEVIIAFGNVDSKDRGPNKTCFDSDGLRRLRGSGRRRGNEGRCLGLFGPDYEDG